jgi:hypothetical protein
MNEALHVAAATDVRLGQMAADKMGVLEVNYLGIQHCENDKSQRASKYR